jgi:cobalt/nickel transport protein
VKAYIKVIILTLICLAVLTPLASDFPDGLKKVAETLGIEEHDPAWKGLMPDYTLPTIDNPYISTFVASTFGVFLVLGVAFILGIVITKPSR